MKKRIFLATAALAVLALGAVTASYAAKSSHAAKAAKAATTFKVGLNTVGRMPDNDVVVQDAYVSRRHCAIVVHTGDRCEVHDIASKNGTYLNGHKISGPTRRPPGKSRY